MDNRFDEEITNAVQLVSKSENYQKKLFVFLCLMCIQSAFNSLINPMLFSNPLFVCTSEDGSETYSSETFACINKNTCRYENSFTATFSAGLYCENRNMRMMVQSFFAFGCIFGILLMPILCEIKGKKLITNITIFLLFLGNILLFYGINFEQTSQMLIGQFLSAFGSAAMTSLIYSLSSDFFSKERRERTIFSLCILWGLTNMVAMTIWYIIPDWWVYLNFLLILPTLLFYIYFQSFFIESVHFVANVHFDFKGSHYLIDKLSFINKANSEDTFKAHRILKELQNSERSDSKRTSKTIFEIKKETLKTIFKNSKYYIAIVCLALIRMGGYSFYYGVQGSLERTGFNFGISIFLLGLGEVTGYSIGEKFIPLLKRKTTAVVSNLLIAFLGFLCLSKTIGDSPLLLSLVLYISCVLSSFSFSAISLLETESFSSSIRSPAIGMIFGSSFLIRLAIPFAIGFLNESGFPTLVASSFMIIIFGVPPFLALNETFNQSQLEDKLVERSTTCSTNFGDEVELKAWKKMENF